MHGLVNRADRSSSDYRLRVAKDNSDSDESLLLQLKRSELTTCNRPIIPDKITKR